MCPLPTSPTTMHLVTTLPQWEDVCERMLKSVDPWGELTIAYDTETLDKNYPDIGIVGFSLAWFEEGGEIDGCYVPVGHTTGELQLFPQDVTEGLREVLEHEAMRVVMQNAKYDIKISTLFPNGGIQVTENIFDTMTACWYLNTNGVGKKNQVLAGVGSLGLKDQSKYLLNYKMQDLMDLAPKEKYYRNGAEFTTLRTDLVRLEDMGSYAGDDAIQTLKLYVRHREELESGPKKVKKIFDALEAEFAFCLAEMEMDGVELDAAYLDQLLAVAEAELDKTVPKIFENRVGQDFDPIADEALLIHVCDAWEELEQRFNLPRDHKDYPKNPKTGKPAGKGSLRIELMKAHGLRGHPVEEKIRDDRVRPFIEKWPHLAHKAFNAGSTKQLNDILFGENGIIPIGDKNKKGEWSTKDDNMQIWAGQGHEIAEAISRFRDIEKMRGTYLVGMRKQVSEDGRLRGRFNRTGARTGRLSSSNPNLQNIPTSKEFPVRRAFKAQGGTQAKTVVLEWERDREGLKVRPSHQIIASEGGYVEVLEGRVMDWNGDAPPWVLMVADYSQLEIALLAHCSNDEVLVDAVRNELDVHALTARGVFDEIPNDMPLDEVKKKYPDLRSKAKPVNFGVLYGMGPQKLSHTLGISVAEAEDIIENRYMGLYVGVAEWIKRQHAKAAALGFVSTAMGRRRHLPAATLDRSDWNNKRLALQAERQAQNCVDAETEVLTQDGWKHYSEVATGTVILTRDPDTGALEWQAMTGLKVFPESTGTLVEFKSKSFSALTTANHRWLVENKKTGAAEFVTSENLSPWGDHRIYRTGEYAGPEATLTDDEVRLLGWLLTDGHLKKNHAEGSKSFMLGQSQRANPEKVKEIDDLLDRNGWLCSKSYCPTDEFWRWRVDHETSMRLLPLVPEKSLNVGLLLMLSREQAHLLMETMLKGDGTKRRGADGWRFFCDTEERKDMFQMLCTLAGRATTSRWRDMSMYEPQSEKLSNVPKMKGVWAVSVLARDKAQVTHSQRREFESDGRLVWCPQVPNQTWVARRESTVYVTGNSPIQGLAADVVGKAMRDIRRVMKVMEPADLGDALLRPEAFKGTGTLWRRHLRMLLQVHDEVVMEAHPAVANWMMDTSVNLMEKTVELRVPLRVSAAIGENWLDAKE